jgi:hypothetical protein
MIVHFVSLPFPLGERNKLVTEEQLAETKSRQMEGQKLAQSMRLPTRDKLVQNA